MANYKNYKLTQTGEEVQRILNSVQTIDNSVTQNSSHPVTGGAVFSYLNSALSNTVAESGVYDVTVNNNNAKFASLSALLNSENLDTLIPIARRKGGMSIKFVHTYDNKYVQFRLTSASFSANQEDWSISVYSNIISNVSFIYAQTDADGKLLWGIESDGNIYYGTGVPQQVIDYVQEHKFELLSMINNKVDKIEGKVLIDQEFSDRVSFVNDVDFVYIYTDDEDKILWGITTDGDIYYGAGVPSQIIEYVQASIKELGAEKQTRLVTDDNLEIVTEVPEGYIQVEHITGNVNTCRIDTSIVCADDLEIECVFKDSVRVTYGSFFGRYTDENTDALRLIYNASSASSNPDCIVNFNTMASTADGVTGVVPASKHHVILNKNKFTIDGISTTLHGTTKGTSQEGTIIINGVNLITSTGIRTITWWKFIIRNANGDAVFDGVPCKRVSDGAVGLYDKVTNSFFGNAMETDAVFTADGEVQSIKVINPTPLESIYSIKDNESRTELKIDEEEKVVSYRDKEGVLHENAGIETPVVNTSKIEGLSDQGLTDLGNALKRVGFTGGQGDWTDYLSNDGENPLCIPEPRCAILNIISDFNLNNLNKKGYNADAREGVNYDIPTQVEFWDMQGNYFKKWTLMSGQGSSSMGYSKKNIAFDFFDSEAGGDAFAIKFGDWVPQDSFHLKAYMVDFFKCLSVVSYKLAEQAAKTRPYLEDCVWKRGLYNSMNFTPSIFTTEQIDDMNLRLDSGAKCQPDGFPVIVYQNGIFHGVFAWMIKKHRDNYLMNKSNPNHIHLDGQYYTHKLFNGDLDWTTFEVRNPKNLVYATIQTDSETGDTTYKYDADIAQVEIAGNSNGSTSYDTWLAGTYAVGKIVEHGGHLFMNTIADNDAEPVYHSKNNADDAPDFKNKTGCGWLNVTNTVKVKEKIIALSGRLAEIHGAATTEEKKALAETYFDIPSLMDYELIQCAVADTDSIYNNCQWVTYDGIKWAACEYDKDDTFGNHTWLCDVRSEGGWCRSALGSDGIATDNPVGLIRSYYQTEAKTRWQELVDAGIFTTKNIINLTDDWIKRVGVGNYKKEYTKWDSRANRPTNINTEYWEYYGERYNSSHPTYNPNTEYAVGDKCKLSVGSNLYFVFNCIKPCTGEAPCLGANTSNMGWKGNIGQLYKFIEENFRLENEFFDSL